MQPSAQPTTNRNSSLFNERVPAIALRRVPHEVNSLLLGIEQWNLQDNQPKNKPEPFAWLPSKSI